MNLILGQPDPTVTDPNQPAHRGDPNHRRRPTITDSPRSDGIDGVLKQLPDVHPRTGIEMMRKQIDDATKIHLECMDRGRLGDHRIVGHADDRTGARRQVARIRR